MSSPLLHKTRHRIRRCPAKDWSPDLFWQWHFCSRRACRPSYDHQIGLIIGCKEGGTAAAALHHSRSGARTQASRVSWFSFKNLNAKEDFGVLIRFSISEKPTLKPVWSACVKMWHSRSSVPASINYLRGGMLLWLGFKYFMVTILAFSWIQCRSISEHQLGPFSWMAQKNTTFFYKRPFFFFWFSGDDTNMTYWTPRS